MEKSSRVWPWAASGLVVSVPRGAPTDLGGRGAEADLAPQLLVASAIAPGQPPWCVQQCQRQAAGTGVRRTVTAAPVARLESPGRFRRLQSWSTTERGLPRPQMVPMVPLVLCRKQRP